MNSTDSLLSPTSGAPEDAPTTTHAEAVASAVEKEPSDGSSTAARVLPSTKKPSVVAREHESLLKTNKSGASHHLEQGALAQALTGEEKTADSKGRSGKDPALTAEKEVRGGEEENEGEPAKENNDEASAQAASRIPLPCVPVTLDFENLTYDVRVLPHASGFQSIAFVSLYHSLKRRIMRQYHTKRLIYDISGKASPGDLIALMGASGAGKSTLLNILSRRIRSNGGRVLYNGKPTDFGFTRMSCFIQQEDIFFGYITVREHLIMQSKLRIPKLPDGARMESGERANRLMGVFGLDKVADSAIGNLQMGARRGISGGEKKRLSVATELLPNPSVIFADEPTSGLDTVMADSVVTVLQRLAEAGRTIISTIHQPTSEVFEKFTKLMLLAEGRVLYYGDRLGAIPYFIRLDQSCPPYTNPADFFVEILAIPSAGRNREKKLKQITGWAECWSHNGAAFLEEWETSLKTKFQQIVNSVPAAPGLQTQSVAPTDSSPADGKPPLQPKSIGKRDQRFMEALKNRINEKTKSYPATFATQFSVLLWRSILNNRRNPMMFYARLFQTIITALIGGFVYWRIPNNKFISKNGGCFFIVLSQGLVGVLGVLQTFTSETPVALREYYSGTYSIVAYFLAKITSDLPFQIFNPILFTCIIWFMTNLNDNGLRFLEAVLFVFLVTNSAISLGYITSAVSPTLGVALAINPIITMCMVLVSGFMVMLKTLPNFWIWLVYMSPFHWGFSAVMGAIWRGVTIGACTAQSPLPCYENGDDVLEYYDLEKDTIWGNAVALIVQIIVYRFLALVGLVIRTSRGQKV